MSRSGSGPLHDAVVIGSGFGGCMAARALVDAGRRVLMIERGDWVPRGPHNWEPGASVELSPWYTTETPYRVDAPGSETRAGLYTCVGGPSVFYGGVSLRFREADFRTDPDIVGDSGARWPIAYADLEPYYGWAEEILDVAGDAGADPTAPPRSSPYPQEPPSLSRVSERIADAARRLDLAPFPLPLAINYREGEGDRTPCVRCTTCDTFACAVRAKNDLATTVIPELLERGMELRTNTVAIHLEAEAGRITGVRCWDREREEEVVHRGRTVLLCAGALASPHLLLASGLQEMNPAGDAVGRYLMRHRNAIAFGIFPGPPDPVGEFHKQLGIHDFYFGDGPGAAPKLGGIQQVQTPPLELVRDNVPAPLDFFLHPRVDYLSGLLVMAEDQPRAENRVTLDRSRRDPFGLPGAVIRHRYSRRDRAAAQVLVRKAKEILREAGALLFYVHRIKTFSHAVGTVRMGPDPSRDPLDEWCRFRGIENLYVVDGSVLPTSAGLNPSLTIAANALRVGEHLTGEGAGS